MFFVVPNYVSEAIYAAIDAKGVELPDDERENIYHALLSHFNDTGRIPEFDLVKNVEPIHA